MEIINANSLNNDIEGFRGGSRSGGGGGGRGSRGSHGGSRGSGRGGSYGGRGNYGRRGGGSYGTYANYGNTGAYNRYNGTYYSGGRNSGYGWGWDWWWPFYSSYYDYNPYYSLPYDYDLYPSVGVYAPTTYVVPNYIQSTTEEQDDQIEDFRIRFDSGEIDPNLLRDHRVIANASCDWKSMMCFVILLMIVMIIISKNIK